MIETMATTWETIEERERRVRGTRTTSAMVRAAEQIPAADNLKAAFAERPFISRDELRNVARQHDEGPVITLYLNFSPDRPLLSVFDSLRHGELEARKPYIDSQPHTQRLRVPKDLADVRALLTEIGTCKCTVAGDLKLSELRSMYESQLNALSRRLLMPLPSWGVGEKFVENRKKTAWDRITSESTGSRTPDGGEAGHF